MLVEVCANSLESALIAQEGGADRIELCTALQAGGLTPSYGLLMAVKEQVSIPVRVLIRPRSGDFTYSEREFEVMKKDVALCVRLGFEGVVSGVLDSNFSLDEKRLTILMHIAGPLLFTFHRAFDWVHDPLKTFERLVALGVDTLLSSGQRQTAEKGITLLKTLQNNSDHCTVMPGSGIRPVNAAIFKKNGFRAIHLSGSKVLQTLIENPKVPTQSSVPISDGQVLRTDLETIRQVVRSVK